MSGIPTITLSNPDLAELHYACIQHVPGFAQLANSPLAATILLSDYAYCMNRDENGYQIEVKCKGLGCKSREVIGRGEAETMEKAGMIALLEANGVKVKYLNGIVKNDKTGHTEVWENGRKVGARG